MKIIILTFVLFAVGCSSTNQKATRQPNQSRSGTVSKGYSYTDALEIILTCFNKLENSSLVIAKKVGSPVEGEANYFVQTYKGVRPSGHLFYKDADIQVDSKGSIVSVIAKSSWQLTNGQIVVEEFNFNVNSKSVNYRGPYTEPMFRGIESTIKETSCKNGGNWDSFSLKEAEQQVPQF